MEHCSINTSCILSLPVCSACSNGPLVHVITCCSVSSLDFFSADVGFASFPYRSTSPSLLPNPTVNLLPLHWDIIHISSVEHYAYPQLLRYSTLWCQVCHSLSVETSFLLSMIWCMDRQIDPSMEVACLDCVLAGDKLTNTFHSTDKPNKLGMK